MKAPNLNKSPLFSKVTVKVLRYGWLCYSVWQVRTSQKFMVQIQELDMKSYCLFSLQRRTSHFMNGIMLYRMWNGWLFPIKRCSRDVPYQFLIQVNSTDLKVKHEQFCNCPLQEKGGKTFFTVICCSWLTYILSNVTLKTREAIKAN